MDTRGLNAHAIDQIRGTMTDGLVRIMESGSDADLKDWMETQANNPHQEVVVVRSGLAFMRHYQAGQDQLNCIDRLINAYGRPHQLAENLIKATFNQEDSAHWAGGAKALARARPKAASQVIGEDDTWARVDLCLTDRHKNPAWKGAWRALWTAAEQVDLADDDEMIAKLHIERRLVGVAAVAWKGGRPRMTQEHAQLLRVVIDELSPLQRMPGSQMYVDRLNEYVTQSLARRCKRELQGVVREQQAAPNKPRMM